MPNPGKAISYFLKRWDKLIVYTTDASLKIDNNPVENAVRPVAIGRKNYLFAGNHNAAQRAAMIYSLFATCRYHQINPYDWLKDVLERMHLYSTKNLAELLPQNWKKATRKPGLANGLRTKGKIVILKCWFIRCMACVKEFPELNKVVEKYNKRNDMQFISLAWDSKIQLTSFLKTKEFKYAVVPAKDEKYMREQLNVTTYPTHILIDKNGKVVKVVNDISDLVPYIDKQGNKASL